MLKGTSILREQNKRKVLSHIRQLGETSRQDLVNKMNVSKNTVSLIVDEFIQEGILVEIGVQEAGKKGRPKIIIKINEDYLRSIGISVSKEDIEYSVINYYGKVIEKRSITFDCTNATETKKEIMNIIRQLLASYDHIIGIGIGIPAIIDTEKKYIHTSTHLGWSDVSFEELNTIPLPILVQNSVNSGAIEALENGKQHTNNSLFYVRVGDGVGGAYVVNNSLIGGSSFTAGEIGHISIDSSGEKCRCGQRGCLEQLVNYKALRKDLAALKIPPVTTIDGHPFFEATHLQSKTIEKLMVGYGESFGKALVQVIHLMNPNSVIIDTSYNAYASFQQAVLHYLSENALHIPLQHTNIVFEAKRYRLSLGSALSMIINYEKLP